MNKVRFNNEDCSVIIGQYGNGQTSVRLVGEDGSPMATASVCLSDKDQYDNEVFIKDYSENMGILDALVEAGIVSQPVSAVLSGHAWIDICKLINPISKQQLD